MPENDTTMVLKVDLQCKKCRKKVKKILCKFPEIRDQIYDEKQNTVKIKVVSFCPEKLRDKICCLGGSSIKSIEIKPPEKKKETEETKETEKKKKTKELEKKKEPENKPTPPVLALVPVAIPAPDYTQYYPIRTCCPECYVGRDDGPCHYSEGPPQFYDGYYGRPVYDSWGSRAVCTIM